MNPTEPPPSHRRAFVRTLALGAVAAPVALRADDKKPANDKPKDKPEAPKVSEVDARMALIVQRFGPQLDEAARRAVRDEVEGMVSRSERLRKLALDNGDGPYPVFTPFRAPLA